MHWFDRKIHRCLLFLVLHLDDAVSGSSISSISCVPVSRKAELRGGSGGLRSCNLPLSLSLKSKLMMMMLVLVDVVVLSGGQVEVVRAGDYHGRESLGLAEEVLGVAAAAACSVHASLYG